MMSNDQSWIKEGWLKNIAIFLSCGIGILLFIFLLVVLLPSAKCIYMYFTGITTKYKLLEFIGWGMGGFIATLGAVGILWRVALLEDQNKRIEKGHMEQNKLTEKGHVHDRFKAATEHLGNENSISVRIASFNEFYRLAKITAEMPEEEGLKETIFYILCAHLRQTTKDKKYMPVKIKYNVGPEVVRSTEEVQNLLNVLFKPYNKDTFLFAGIHAYLEGVNLQGADLENAYLENADLTNVELQYTNLLGANLKNADLREAKILKDKTIMPDNWEKDVIKYKDEDGREIPCVLFVDSEGEVLEIY